jgi:hypothetical protein
MVVDVLSAEPTDARTLATATAAPLSRQLSAYSYCTGILGPCEA